MASWCSRSSSSPVCILAPRERYVPRIFRSSKNSAGTTVSPCSHISEKNQMPLSPIQKSAGVKFILESSGGSGRAGLYSASQPKASPLHAFPFACSLPANRRTAPRSGITKRSTTGMFRLPFLVFSDDYCAGGWLAIRDRKVFARWVYATHGCLRLAHPLAEDLPMTTVLVLTPVLLLDRRLRLAQLLHPCARTEVASPQPGQAKSTSNFSQCSDAPRGPNRTWVISSGVACVNPCTRAHGSRKMIPFFSSTMSRWVGWS